MWPPTGDASKGSLKGGPTMKGRVNKMSEAERNLPASSGTTLPSLAGEQSLNRYLAEIKKFPVLTAEQEYMLAKRYAEHQDPKRPSSWSPATCGSWPRSPWAIAAMACRSAELISEGNIGLMQGVKKFEPDRGFRLATYAMWWIKASMQEFILRSVEPGQDGHHRRAEEAVLQPAPDEEEPRRLRGYRSASPRTSARSPPISACPRQKWST
jgi:hypothetical protein